MKKLLILVIVAVVIIFVASCFSVGASTQQVDYEHLGSFKGMELYKIELDDFTCFVSDGWKEGGISCIESVR